MSNTDGCDEMTTRKSIRDWVDTQMVISANSHSNVQANQQCQTDATKHMHPIVRLT